ncbi:hypothetical protein SNE40_017694 [Patella caerulea]|uniref:Uncharacterized protein n=1 Tax=Patella caerulea TaxID=87958 RepID=A0AAN8JBL0_PATCE
MKSGGIRRLRKQKETKKGKQMGKTQTSNGSANGKEETSQEKQTKSTLFDASLEALDQLFRESSAEDILKLGPRPELLGMTPLAMAASVGNVEAVTKLLAADADVNEKSNLDATALMQVTRSKNLDIAELLLKSGASLTQTNVDGDNAFMLAVSTGDAKLINMMWPYKDNLDINHHNRMGNTALHLAAEKKWDTCIQFLLQNGSDVNKQNNVGWTPLFTAATLGDLRTVERISNAGSDLLIEDTEGNTALCRAILEEKEDVADFISKRLTDLEKAEYCNSRVDRLLEPDEVTANGITQYYDEVLYPVLLHLCKYDHLRSALKSSRLIQHLVSIAYRYIENSQVVALSCFICTMLMFRYSSGTDERFVGQFQAASGPDFILHALSIYDSFTGGLIAETEVTTNCFLSILPLTESSKGQAWIKQNSLRLSTYIEIAKNMNLFSNHSMDEGCKFKFKMMWKQFITQYESAIRGHREHNLVNLLEEEEREKILKDKKRDRRKMKKLNKKQTAQEEMEDKSLSGSCSSEMSIDSSFDENNHSKLNPPTEEPPSEGGSPEKCDNLETESEYNCNVINANDIDIQISLPTFPEDEDKRSEWVKVSSTKKLITTKTVAPKPQLQTKTTKPDHPKQLDKPQTKPDKPPCVEKKKTVDSPKSWADIAKGYTTVSTPDSSPIIKISQPALEPFATIVKHGLAPLKPGSPDQIKPTSPIGHSTPVKQNESIVESLKVESSEYYQDFPSLNGQEVESIWGPCTMELNQPKFAKTTDNPEYVPKGLWKETSPADTSFGAQLDKELAEESSVPPGFEKQPQQEVVDWWDGMGTLQMTPPPFQPSYVYPENQIAVPPEPPVPVPQPPVPVPQPPVSVPQLPVSVPPDVFSTQHNMPNLLFNPSHNGRSLNQVSMNPIVHQQPINMFPNQPISPPNTSSQHKDENPCHPKPNTDNLPLSNDNLPMSGGVVNSIMLNDGTILNFNMPNNFNLYPNINQQFPPANGPAHLNDQPRDFVYNPIQTPVNYASATMMDPQANIYMGNQNIPARSINPYEGVTPPPMYPWPDRKQEYDDYMEQMWNSAMLLPSVFQLPGYLRESVMPGQCPSDTVLYPASLRDDEQRDPETSSDYSTQSSENTDSFPSFHDGKDLLSSNFLFEELTKEQIRQQSKKLSSNSSGKDNVYLSDLDYYRSLYGLMKEDARSTAEEERSSPVPEWATEPHNPDYEIQTVPFLEDECDLADFRRDEAVSSSPPQPNLVSRRWKSKLEEIKSLPATMRRHVGNIVMPVQSANYNINLNGNSVVLGYMKNGAEIAVKVIESKQSRLNHQLIDKLNSPSMKHHFLLKYLTIERSGNKLYLASELCDYTLEEYIHIVGLSHQHDPLSANKLSWQLLKGLNYLHTELGIIHGNMKPQNIFVDFDGKLCLGGYGVDKLHRLNRMSTKPSDERLWKASECLSDNEDIEPTTYSDVQVCGMLIYYILTGGKHPYGENPYEIEVNICQNWGQMMFISEEANDLTSAMLFSDITARPTIEQCLGHPFFWSDEKRFRLILIAGSDVLKEMKTGMAVTGTGSTTMIDFLNVVPTDDVSEDWMSDLDPVVLKDMRSFRQYKNTLAELVLFLYNCCLHFDKMSPSAREVMDDPCRYFLAKFPHLFMAVYRAIKVSDRTNRTCYKPFYLYCC